MKKVYSVYVKGEFKQFLKISEGKFIKDMCLAFGEVTIKITEIPTSHYKIAFGL